MAIDLTGKSTRMITRMLGIWLVVVSFVLAQFVEFTLLDLDGFDVSLQKIIALIIFPIAFVLMGHIRVCLPLLVCVGVLILTNSAAYLAELDPLNVTLLSANVTIVSGFLGAAILYTALRQDVSGFYILGRVWVAFAVVTSILVLGQSIGLLPIWAV
jgi:hypothetical protein